jgi:hypothetical protein
MYNVLKNGKVIAKVDTLETALKLVRSLEAYINKATHHSPYTLELSGEFKFAGEQGRIRNSEVNAEGEVITA